MALKDFIQGRGNRIVIGGAAGTALIITAVATVFSNWVRPAILIESADNERLIEITTGGAILVGTGATPAGASGDCLKSGGGSGKQMTFGTCGSGGASLVDHYVNAAGDTMTGALIIDITSGNPSTLGLRIIETASGRHLHAEQTLSSSGALVWEGQGSGSALYIGGTFEGVGLTDCDADAQALSWDATTKRFVCGDDDAGAGAITAGQGLTLVSNVMSLNTTISGSLVRFTTLSGAVVYAKTTLASSGTLVFEGAASGSTLYLGGKLEGAGLTDCDLATQTLAWDTTTGRFSCGTDADTTYTPGQGLSLNGTAFSLTASHSGTVIWAGTSLRSSGAITWEGAASGATLYLGGKLEGAGLSDCDADGQTLAWDATTGRFSCGDDDSGGAAGLVDHYVNAGGDTMTGALVIDVLNGNGSTLGLRIVNTASGRHLHAEQRISSSGSLTWEGAGSGSALYIGGTFEGVGLTDCDGDSQTLAWDLISKRFGCGTDSNTTYTAGQGLTLLNGVFSLTASHSGSVIRATTTLASSGTLVWEGAGSGSSLTISTNLYLSGALVVDKSATLGWLTSKVLYTDSNAAMNGVSGTSNQVMFHTGTAPEFRTSTGSAVWYIGGGQATGTDKSASFKAPCNLTAKHVYIQVKNAPSGTALIYDINENGTTIFSTRPQVAAGAITGGTGAILIDTSIAQGSLVTIDVDQVGNTGQGTGATIQFYFNKSC